jgi:hypothetical protein
MRGDYFSVAFLPLEGSDIHREANNARERKENTRFMSASNPGLLPSKV